MRALASTVGLASLNPWYTLKNTMKNTSVTPSATFDQMPSPNQSVKIGASTTRGSALAILTKGSNTAAMRGCAANQKPITMAAAEPVKKASIASLSVTQRCFQMVPSANH